LAFLLIKKGAMDEGIEEFSRCIELDPKTSVVRQARAAVYCDLHQYKKAIADWTKIIELKPKVAVFWLARGNVFCQNDQYDKALEDYSKAIELEPKKAVAWDYRARAYYYTHQYDKAAADLAKALELSPPNRPFLQNNLAWLLATDPEAKHFDPKRAVELAATAVKAIPKSADFWTTLGVARYRAGDFQGAAEALQNALKLFQGTSDSHGGVGRTLFFLSMAHQELGHRQEARQTYDRALAWLETNRKAVRETPELAHALRRFQTEAEKLLKQQSGVRDRESRTKREPGRPKEPTHPNER
jgi:tetratricopeptide (TPR) repeat protein